MNILRYKQKAQNHVAMELAGNDGGWASSNNVSNTQVNTDPNNVDENGYTIGNYGGYTTGSDTNATTPDQVTTAKDNYSSPNANDGSWGANFSSPTQLSDLFSGDFANNTLNNYSQSGMFAPGSTLYNLGLRSPGTTAEQTFNSETPQERDTRMGMVGSAIGGVGNLVTGGALSMSPIGPAISLAKAFDSYGKNQDLGQAVATGISGIPGWGGVIGNVASGNYGSAIARGLGLGGVNSTVSALAGTGADLLSGKNIAPSLGSIIGQTAGRTVGGNSGAAFGAGLGQMYGKNYSLRY